MTHCAVVQWRHIFRLLFKMLYLLFAVRAMFTIVNCSTSMNSNFSLTSDIDNATQIII